MLDATSTRDSRWLNDYSVEGSMLAPILAEAVGSSRQLARNRGQCELYETHFQGAEP
jgi:hypothetical protein